jgi:hypothetical protein
MRRADTIQLWEKLPAESPQAFAAFARYRDMGEDRSLRALSQTLGKRLSLLGKWSARHCWQQRVEAFDLYLDRQLQRQRLKTVREEHTRSKQIIAAAKGKLIVALNSVDTSRVGLLEWITAFCRLAMLERLYMADDLASINAELDREEAVQSQVSDYERVEEKRLRRIEEEEREWREQARLRVEGAA